MQHISATQAGIPQADSARTALVIAVVALFFIWGGITSLNDVLIPKFKDLFRLTYTQAMLVQFAFFAAYAVVSLPAGGLVARLGYGRGIVTGLAIMGCACLLFVPAASNASYTVFLIALFVLASGITLLQVAANPLIANLGDPASGHSRLTLAQAFNSLGTTVMPFLGAQVILGEIASVDAVSLSGAELVAFQARESAVVGKSYLGLAIVLFAMAVLFWLKRDRLGRPFSSSASLAGSLQLLSRRPRLSFGVLGIFLYVGAEVTVGSFLVSYLMLPSTLDLAERTAGEYLALYWGGAMVGRFFGAVLLRHISAGVLLTAVSAGAAVLSLFSSVFHGPAAAWALIAVGLMNAIMFPTIFSLASERMGAETPRASGLLCMAIVGGAIIPVIAGTVADASSIAGALMVPVICYVGIAGFGWFARRPVEDYLP